MKKHTKFVSALLVGAMVFSSMFTGCGDTKVNESKNSEVASEKTNDDDQAEVGTEELEPVHLVLFMNQVAGADDEKIAAAINELEAVKALNVTVEFKTIAEGEDFFNKLDLELASGSDEFDIVVGELTNSYIERARNGAYADITDYVNAHQELVDALLPEHWEAATVDGSIYGVPTFKETTQDFGFYIPHSVVEEYNLDITDLSIFDMEPVLEALVDAGHETFMLTYNGMSALVNAAFFESYFRLSGWYATVSYDDPDTVVNYFATDRFKELCHMTKDWYDKGLIDKDVMTVENYSVETRDPDLHGLAWTCHAPLAEYALSAAYGFDLDYIQLTPTTGAISADWSSCVNAKSKNIERAVDFLALWNTNSDVKNMITYGIEGEHYDLVDGCVDYTNYPNHLDAWHAENARLGNMTISYPTVGMPEEGYGAYRTSFLTARKQINRGFALDKSSIANEVAACDAVTNEYMYLLASGLADDVDATIAEFLEKLEAAGMQKVIDEAQTQWTAFRASK